MGQQCDVLLGGEDLVTTVCGTARYTLVGTSTSPGSTVPGVTHWATGVSPESSPSPSAMTTSASHGMASGSPAPARRSQGRVRRLSTICGSRSENEPSALAGGKVDRI